MGRSRVSISGGFCVLLALFVLTVPFPWLIAALFCAMFHELGHIIMIYLLGGRVRFGSLGSSSAVLLISPMSRGREALAAAGGPLFNLLLIPFCRLCPRIAICAGFQLLYNLLPLYPMDGGRIIACLLSEKVCVLSGKICRLSLWIFSFWLAFGLKMGLFPLLLGMLLWIRTK
jgi:Zn-dependent protease